MELKKIIAALKEERHLTTKQLAEKSGVPAGTINKLLNGETTNPTMTTLNRLAEALSCPAQTLLQGSARGDILDVHTATVPLLGEIAAGKPIYADEKQEMIPCADSLKCDFALRVRGDSMTGARILDGDLVFIRAQDDVDDGDIAAVIVNDEATLKHVYHIKNGVQLISDNPKYPPMLFTLDECDSIRVLGKAVAFQSRL